MAICVFYITKPITEIPSFKYTYLLTMYSWVIVETQIVHTTYTFSNNLKTFKKLSKALPFQKYIFHTSIYSYDMVYICNTFTCKDTTISIYFDIKIKKHV